jgi:cyclophilin family peptidyl-prolyl cis-trans isomerase
MFLGIVIWALSTPVIAGTKVEMQTSLGLITLELFDDQAPLTVKNFVAYATDGAYDDTIFHRVIDGFMIQGGGFDQDYQRRPTQDPIQNEADNGLKNTRGTIAMARTPAPHSASSQFFINVADNPFLDHSDKTPRGWGYCVFGEVTSGMEVVDAIRAVQTGSAGPFPKDVPLEPVIIERVTIGGP